MSRFFDHLEAQLHSAARAQVAGGRPRRRRRGRRFAAGVPAVMAVATALAVAIVAIVLLGHHGPAGHRAPAGRPAAHPPAASGPPRFPALPPVDHRVFNAVMRARYAATRVDAACGHTVSTGARPAPSGVRAGDPDAVVLRTLGVLRRPRASADRPPSHAGVYPPPPAGGVYVDDIRLARRAYGSSYYVVPAADVNEYRTIPARCAELQRTALRRQLHTLPVGLRPAALRLQIGLDAYDRRVAAPYPGVFLCLLDADGHGRGCTGYSVGQIESGAALVTGGPTGVGVLHGLAPDGVRSVTLAFRTARGSRSYTVGVVDNVFVLRGPRDRLPDDGEPVGRPTFSGACRSCARTRTRTRPR